MPMYYRWRHTIVAMAVVTPLLLFPLQFARSAAPPKAQLPTHSVKATPKAQLPAGSVKATQKAQLPARLVKATQKAQLPARSVKATPKAQLAARSVKAIPKAQLPTRSVETNRLQPEPLRLPNTAIEPIDWNALKGWEADDHAAAFATFLTSCRPLLRTSLRDDEKRDIRQRYSGKSTKTRLPPITTH